MKKIRSENILLIYEIFLVKKNFLQKNLKKIQAYFKRKTIPRKFACSK